MNIRPTTAYIVDGEILSILQVEAIFENRVGALIDSWRLDMGHRERLALHSCIMGSLDALGEIAADMSDFGDAQRQATDP